MTNRRHCCTRPSLVFFRKPSTGSLLPVLCRLRLRVQKGGNRDRAPIVGDGVNRRPNPQPQVLFGDPQIGTLLIASRPQSSRVVAAKGCIPILKPLPPKRRFSDKEIERSFPTRCCSVLACYFITYCRLGPLAVSTDGGVLSKYPPRVAFHFVALLSASLDQNAFTNFIL